MRSETIGVRFWSAVVASPWLALIFVGVALAGCARSGLEKAESAGSNLYRQNCALCHGMKGEGQSALGKRLVDNEFVQSKSDEELVQFLTEGRRANHPLNERGVDMPPRGGNPGLTDGDLRELVLYLRGLN